MVENENIKAEIEGDDYITDDYEIADINHKRKKLRKTPNVDKTILCSNCVVSDICYLSYRIINSFFADIKMYNYKIKAIF